MRKPVHYYGLDLLRIVAAALVVSDHFGAFGWAHPVWSTSGDALAFPALSIMENVGSIGVEIFFLISGFVIAASAKGATASRFAASRAIRVFPALWLCGLIAFAARLHAGEPLGALAADYVRSATISPVGPYIDGVVWTLVVEAVFYVLIFLLLLGKSFGRLDGLAKVLGSMSLAFIAVYVATRLAAGIDPRFGTIAALCGRYVFKVLLLRHGVFFALGMLMWSSFEYGFTRGRLAWAALFALFCSLEITVEHGSAVEILISLALWWAGLALIVASVAKGEWVAARIGRWSRLVQDLGRLSYPLYLNHFALGYALVPALFAAGLPRGAVLALSLTIVVVSSYAIMRWPERLAQKALRRRLLGKPGVATVEQPARPAVVGW